METQLNSSETDVEDSEELNTEEVFTENDSDVIPAEDHNDPEVDDVLRDELQEISQQLSRRHMIDEYVPDSSAPLKCLNNCQKSGHKCKDCNEYFPIVKEKNTEPEPVPEKNQSPPKKNNVTKTKKHTHKRSVREKQWRENMPCSSVDKKISRQKGDKSWNLKANGSITTMHAEAIVCTSHFHTHNHHHSCMVLSVFSDGQYAQVSSNKKLVDRVLPKGIRESLTQWAKEEMESMQKAEPVQQEIDPPSEEDLQAIHKKIFKDYVSMPFMLMNEVEFEAKTTNPLKVQEARQIITTRKR